MENHKTFAFVDSVGAYRFIFIWRYEQEVAVGNELRISANEILDSNCRECPLLILRLDVELRLEKNQLLKPICVYLTEYFIGSSRRLVYRFGMPFHSPLNGLSEDEIHFSIRIVAVAGERISSKASLIWFYQACCIAVSSESFQGVLWLRTRSTNMLCVAFLLEGLSRRVLHQPKYS